MRIALAIAGMLLCGGTLHSQTVVVRDVGRGASGRIIQLLVRGAHRVVEPDTGWFVLERGTHERGSLLVLGRSAAVAGTVDGDVVVVDGDLFVRPGGRIRGRAIAVGGGVYPSALAFVEGGTQSFRDNTFTISRIGGEYVLDYSSLREHASAPLLLPGVYGLRGATYDRVNGLSLAFGPTLSIDTGRAELNALITYRSDLGKFDPSLTATAQLTRRTRATARAARTTFSNDEWIWPDLVNTLSALGTGIDTRNYYRADRAELRLHRLWETTRAEVEPFVGARVERAWSVGPAIGEQRGPWSLFGRRDLEGMLRPNPAIDPGQIFSALGGARIEWESQNVEVGARTSAELGLSAPNDARFTQLTNRLDVGFPTFGEQTYEMEVHWITTFGDTPPPRQRFVYLGGAGTLSFLDLLEQGGDELLLVDQRYSVPVDRVNVGLLGSPTFILRHRFGSAGIGGLPRFEQVLGFGVILALLRAEVQLDPREQQARFSVGLSFSR